MALFFGVNLTFLSHRDISVPMRVAILHSMSSAGLAPRFAPFPPARGVCMSAVHLQMFPIAVCVARREVFHLPFKVVEWVSTSNNFAAELTISRYCCTLKYVFTGELVFLEK